MTDELGPRLLPVSRRAQILGAIDRAGIIRVSDLVDKLQVSPITVRRDITRLAEEGLVERVHGGARSVPRTLPGTRSEPRRAAPLAPVIGMLVPSLDYYWPGVVQGAEATANAHGMGISLQGSSYTNDDERPQLARLVQSDGVAGLVVAPNLTGPHGAELTEWLANSGLPVVLVERTADREPRGEALESVITDHVRGAAVAVRHLAQLGHRRVGVVTNELSPTSRYVRAGWEQVGTEQPTLVAGAVSVDLPDRHSPGWSEALDAVVESCLSTGTTAVLVHSDPEAMAVVERCLADPGRPVHRVVISPTLHVRASTASPAQA